MPPGDFNDRLLLGLKGKLLEVELYQIKARMVRGRMNKVKRGEYAFQLPRVVQHNQYLYPLKQC